jgi:peptidoglycan L-alanyl-D-glutamate endopeptidase CwlK
MASRSTSDLHPLFQPEAEEFLDELDEAGIPHVVTCTRRSIHEQREAYEQGRTKPGRIVTNAGPGESPHNYGLGMDVYPLIHGKLCTAFPEGDQVSDPIWQRFGAIAKRCGLVWGGDFKLKDACHVEYRNWKVLTGGMHI